MKRPPEERERLLRLLRITAVGGLVIVLLGAHGGMLDRLDAHLFAGVAAYYVIAAFGFA